MLMTAFTRAKVRFLKRNFSPENCQNGHLEPGYCVKYLRTIQIVCRILPRAPVLYAINKGSNSGVGIA